MFANNAPFSMIFCNATGFNPFPYQEQLADRDTWPEVIKIPTGLGKTAAIILAWIYKRHYCPILKEAIPRRLVYCLPTRSLVEQIHKHTATYLKSLNLLAENELPDEKKIALYVIMGGETDDTWHQLPEQDCIIIGTQDMLLSRALNRGYGLSRFRWPMAFGLLNNDCLWVFDEVQLMGAGIPTSAQLHAFRKQLGTVSSCISVWMSATLENSWLETVDNPAPDASATLQLSKADLNIDLVLQRMQAMKILNRLDLRSRPGTKHYPREVAQQISLLHTSKTRTLVMVNTVERAQKIFKTLKEEVGSMNKELRPELCLLHSRMRPPDRKARLDSILNGSGEHPGGTIVVCTQALEAGVDISSALLITELAPWASLVQRFGRLNRYGELTQAKIYWIDVSNKHAPPYSFQELANARKILIHSNGCSMSPGSLPHVDLSAERFAVIRKKDLLDLFDNSADLSGNDVDVSRFIRDSKETDCQVCWREVVGLPPEDWPVPVSDELCSVPIGQLREFMRKNIGAGWIWDHLDRTWRRLRPEDIWPGQVIVMDARVGGYDPELGWDPLSSRRVECQPITGEISEATGDDKLSFTKKWQTIIEHTAEVVEEIKSILLNISIPGLARFEADLEMAAKGHDYGKAHHVFKETMMAGLSNEEKALRLQQLWAKSNKDYFRHSRPHFRHELASLLGLYSDDRFSDMALYLIASHHGRVRIGIRSLPGTFHSTVPGNPKMVLGIEDGDRLPELTLSSDLILQATELKLDPVYLGLSNQGDSWLARTLALRDSLKVGPFRLAYLEALLRVADARASARPQQGGDLDD
jgi:CRISPR-associated endonuclease/helicase Cas3